MHKYEVIYDLKYDCASHPGKMTVSANTARDAVDKVRKAVLESTGRHAFHPKAKRIE